MEFLKRNEKGITLIALVVTIVILLILASISIGALTGDNGIIDQAHTAKEDTEIASWEEKIDLAIIDAEKKHRTPTLDDVKEELKNKGIINDYSQVNKDGIITTNEPVYEITGKLDDYIPFEPGKFATKNEIYTDTNGDTATIPEGFKILENASIVDNGLVIQDEFGNQFVWIPVKNPIASSEEEALKTKALALKDNSNYKGLIYNTSSISSNYYEPFMLESDYSSKYNTNLFTQDSLQEDFNNMIKSVMKYYGFYIGRYELGLENNTPVVKNANTDRNIQTLDSSNENSKTWYGLYSKCKEFAAKGSNKSVISDMLYGCQYSSMLNWFTEQGEDITALKTSEANKTFITGYQSSDFIKNIFDLYGCHMELTQTASSSYSSPINYRIAFSDMYGQFSLNTRTASLPEDISTSRYSTRITLYIK